MANMQSIVEDDTQNINKAGSDIKPYPLSSSDISKQTQPKNIKTQEEAVGDIDTSINLQSPQQTEQKQKLSEQDKFDIQRQQQNELAQSNDNLNKPELTWDTARDDQKLFFSVEKGGHSYYDYYINDGDELKIVRINSSDPKVVGRRIALSKAKSKDEADEIWFASYFDDKNSTYLPYPYKRNDMLTFVKGSANNISEWVEGVNRMAVDNARYFATKSLEKLYNELTDVSKSPDYSYMLLQTPKTLATIAGMSEEEKQDFFSAALDRYIKGLEDQSKNYSKTSIAIEIYKAELMKNIPDPVKYLQDLEDGVDYADKKFKEFIESDEVKKYLNPQEIKDSEAITKAFKENPYIAEKMERIKIGSKKINEMYDAAREFIGTNYDPRFDSELVYKAGGIASSYAVTAASIMTHGVFPSAILFAGASYKETMDKAIEKGLPIGTSLLAADINAVKEAVTEQLQLKFFRANFSTINELISKEMFNVVFENALQEGIQDFMQKGVEQIFGIDQFTFEDYLTDFIINAGIGALMSVPMGAVVQYNKVKYIRSLKKELPKGISEKQVISIAEHIINIGTKIMSTKAGSESFVDVIDSALKISIAENLKSKTGKNYDTVALDRMIDSTYKYLTSNMSLEEKEKFRKDYNDATEFTKKYLVETVGMFDAEAKELSKGLNKLYTTMQLLTGMSRRQIAEKFLPNTVNMMALSAISDYKYAKNKKDFIKFESGILKTIFRTLGPIQHLTDADFLNMAKDVLNGMPMEQVANKYKVLYDKNKYDTIRSTVLINKVNFPALSIMLENSNIKNKELTSALNDLVRTSPANRELYNAKANDFYNMLNKALNNGSTGGALFGNNQEVTNPVEAFNTLFLNKPISGVDIHEYGHFFDMVYYANQMSAKLGLPTTVFNVKIMNLYNVLGRKITGNKDFVYNPYNYSDPDQIKVAEALPNIMAQYLIDGKEYDKDSAELIKYISSLYKYINSTTTPKSEYADTKEAKELVKEIQKQEKEDALSVALDKLLKLADTGYFNNQDIYNIVKDLKLNEALKLALYIEKGQHPVVTLIQAINDINNTRVDSMYRKSIDYNEDIIPSKNLIIPENAIGGQDQERIRENVEKAKATWNDSSKNIHTIRHIYNKYNTYLNKEGKWNYVVSDKDIKFNEGNMEMLANKAKLGMGDDDEGNVRIELKELIGHKELFQSINSGFFNTVVAFSDNVDEPRVVMEGSNPLIYLPKRLITSNSNDSRTELKSELVYGMQQAIDTYFNVAEATDIEKELYNIIRNQKISDPKYAQNLLAALTNQRLTQGLSEEQQKVYDTLSQALEKAISRFNNNIGVNRAEYSASNMDKKFFDLFETLPKDVKTNSFEIPTKYLKEQDLTKSQLSNIYREKVDNKQEKQVSPEEKQDLNFTVSDIMSDNFSKTFAVVSEVFKKDSPKLYAHSRQAMFKSMQDVKRYKQQAKDLMISVNKMSKEDKYAFKKAWNNRDMSGLITLADKYDFRDEIVAIKATLNELHQIVASAFEGESYNQLLGYLQNYFPRLVINHDGLASYLVAKDSDKGAVKTDTPETTNNKYDKWMDKVKSLLEEDFNYSKKKIGSPYFYKQRQIEFVDDNMLEFYAEPADAFDNYINKVQDILFRKYFFGNGYVKEFMNSSDKGKNISINGIDYVIPNWKERVKKMGFLTGDKKTDARILGAIESVFFRGDTGSFGAIYRTATNILTINSFFSALSNLGDLALTLYNYGLKNTMQAVKDVAVKDAALTSEDLGIMDLYEEFKADGTKLKKVFNSVMKWSGFNYLDRFTKEVNVQAALLDAKKALETSGPKTEQVIDKIYMYMGGDEESANALIANLINDNWKDQDVRLFAFNELSNQQPITKLEVPEFYNKYPQFRVLYLYKTFAVKQLNFAYANVLADIKNNPKEGFKKLIRFMAWLMAVGVTKDIIADMLKGKEIHLTDSAMFSITSFFFLNEYNYYTFKNKGAIMGVFHMVMPPVPLMTEISSDVKRASKGKIDNPMQLKVIRGVPVIGKPFSYWFGD